jgi:peptide/nickel transport system ATP-binding protein
VIAPDDLDLPQSVWRSVFSLRVDLRNGDLGLDSVRERLTAEGRLDGQQGNDAATELPDSALREGVREEYDLPAELPDETAEPTLADALKPLAEGTRRPPRRDCPRRSRRSASARSQYVGSQMGRP